MVPLVPCCARSAPQPQGMLTTRLQLHPASLSSKLHRAIQIKSVEQATKQVKVRTTAASVDKTRQEEEAKMRELHKSRCAGVCVCAASTRVGGVLWGCGGQRTRTQGAAQAQAKARAEQVQQAGRVRVGVDEDVHQHQQPCCAGTTQPVRCACPSLRSSTWMRVMRRARRRVLPGSAVALTYARRCVWCAAVVLRWCCGGA